MSISMDVRNQISNYEMWKGRRPYYIHITEKEFRTLVEEEWKAARKMSFGDQNPDNVKELIIFGVRIRPIKWEGERWQGR